MVLEGAVPLGEREAERLEMRSLHTLVQVSGELERVQDHLPQAVERVVDHVVGNTGPAIAPESLAEPPFRLGRTISMTTSGALPCLHWKYDRFSFLVESSSTCTSALSSMSGTSAGFSGLGKNPTFASARK